jgi:3-oxoacyl-[acyl-carrier-protein] synthase-3
VLVIGAEILTRMTDPDDRRTAAVFGDGAGAASAQPAPTDRAGSGPVTLGADGTGAPLLFASKPAAWSRWTGQPSIGTRSRE